MTRFEIRHACVVAFGISASMAMAQQGPSMHQLGPVIATSTEKLGNVSAVRQLSNGRVLVNDAGSRRLLLFDSTLSNPIVVADSTSGVSNAYGVRAGILIAYHGDSTFLVNVASPSMLLVDPVGKIAAVRSVPRTQDAAALTATSAFDAAGRLVYRGRLMSTISGAPSAGKGLPVIPQLPDSAAVVRVNLTTRQLDTAGFVKIPSSGLTVTQNASGGFVATTEINPLPMLDEWAVVADGSIAFVRGRDYHVDWVNPDGSRSSSPRIPFDWQRLTDDNKVSIVDSARTAIQKAQATALTTAGGSSQATQAAQADAKAAAIAGAAGSNAGGNGMKIVIMNGGGGDGGAPIVAGSSGGTASTAPQINVVDPSKLPDYRPPFTAGAVRADMDGNLWIRTATKPMVEGFAYDVVNRRGELVDRVQLPPNSTVVGFGPGGVIYLSGRDAAGYRLVRARVK